MIYSGYTLAVTHNINESAMSTTDKNYQSAIRFIDQNPFIFYIIYSHISPSGDTICLRFGHRDLP
ncbi:diguanylate cyclase/phosphodiesterase with PAS/PAC sensor(s) [Edwardsiella piscicida]|nr:hypothetical protein QY76_13840 [Edwardsiella sp. EA181011]GAJ66569.1 diguanylate cyclase/phosphodiesterase with PAS/PAC sensor(s) [Edwardsiella piscicida]